MYDIILMLSCYRFTGAHLLPFPDSRPAALRSDYPRPCLSNLPGRDFSRQTHFLSGWRHHRGWFADWRGRGRPFWGFLPFIGTQHIEQVRVPAVRRPAAKSSLRQYFDVRWRYLSSRTQILRKLIGALG